MNWEKNWKKLDMRSTVSTKAGDAMKMNQICILENVEKYYCKGCKVLGPISLSVFQGEILGLRGQNGAGKSTLLKILAGVIQPDTGRYIQREDLRGQVGYVPQDVALYTSLSGLDNLYFWGAVYGLPHKAAVARSRWLLHLMELTEKAHTPVSAYSGGMRRRLHLATAMMITPKLLLLDEPTVGADLHSAKLILSTLENLRSRGCGIVLVTHQAGELEMVCDRIITLENGHILDGGGLL